MTRRLLPALCCLCLLAGCANFVEVEVVRVDRPALDVPAQSEVYAADGSLIATLRFANRELVDREDLPDVLLDAVVAGEDRRFYEHDGVDLRAVARALVANQRAGEVVQGGSTITQQLVKNRYFPDADRSVERKVEEARLARDIEQHATKDEILTDYLNTVYFGAGAYGVQAAARTYFGIDVGALDLVQATLLAGLLRAPESASPLAHPEQALAERARVLDAMAEEAMIDPSAAEAAKTAPLAVQPPPPPPVTRYPYFVEYVKRALLADPTLGADEPSRVRRLFGGGLRIHTTIDPAVQAAAERSATVLGDPGDPEVGIAVVRPSDGALVALVGGRDFAAAHFDVASQAKRQPGSTMKTFALVTALREGRRLDDRIDSGSVVLNRGQGLEPWSVRSSTSGFISLNDALVKSSNGAYARLAMALGGQRISDQARLMGVNKDLGDHPAVALGGVREGVNALDLASGYATIANAGVHRPTMAVTGVTDAEGAPVWAPTADPIVAMDAEAAWMTTQALRGVVEEGTGQAARLDRPAAGKTGTSQNYADAWFVGFTPDLAAAVWVGYPDAERSLLGVQGVNRVSGGTWPAEIWRRLMTEAHIGKPILDFAYPSGLTYTVQVDPTTGGLATAFCPLRVPVTGLRGELPRNPCPVHTAPPPPKPETTTVIPTQSEATPAPALSPASAPPEPPSG